MSNSTPFIASWGIIGTGWIASEFAKDISLVRSSLPPPFSAAYRKDGKEAEEETEVLHEVVAVGSRSEEKATEFIKEFLPDGATAQKSGMVQTKPVAVGSYTAVISRPDVQIIYIATPHTSHYSLARLALEAGKHVLVEKPATLVADEWKALMALAKEKNVFLMEAVWTRFLPLSYELQKVIHVDGAIGDVRAVYSDFCMQFLDVVPDTHRVLSAALAGGGLLDLGPYVILPVLLALYHHPSNDHASPTNLTGRMMLRNGVDLSTSVTMDFDKLQAKAFLSTSVAYNGMKNCATRIVGTKGEIIIAGPTSRMTKMTVRRLRSPPGPMSRDFEDEVIERNFPQFGLFWEADAVARSIRDGELENLRMPHAETLMTMKMFDEIRRQGGYKFADGLVRIDAEATVTASSTKQQKVLIVGGGPVGALAALSFLKRGWQVELWEARSDSRHDDVAPANLRSINLALSSRGIQAMRSVDPDLAESILKHSIPMKGRMIHHPDGRQESQLYDPGEGQCINSLARPLLNQKLLQALPDEVKLRFEVKLDRVDFNNRVAFPKHAHNTARPGEEADQESAETDGFDAEGVPFDLIVGCDGSWSKVRQEMMRVQRMDFSQSFIPHAYIELHMPPASDGSFAIDANHLHIWPRHSFMLIGLPNQDSSFTLTLFAPFSEIEKLTTRQSAVEFLRQHFPTAVKWAGEERMSEDLQKNPRGSLVTMNVTPYHFDSSVVLLGDAAHSMVPFYGQGLNCGLEDVRVLNCFLDSYGIGGSAMTAGTSPSPLEQALAAYSQARAPDLKAICELAMDNYMEMRSHVLMPMHHVRRAVDAVLSSVLSPSKRRDVLLASPTPFPTTSVSGWSSLYNMVTFRPDVPYHEALRKEKSQKAAVGNAALLTGVLTAVGVGYAVLSRTTLLDRLRK